MKTTIVLMTITVISAAPGFAQSCDPPGEFVGITEFSEQSYGASPQRISLDSLGGVHIIWTRGSFQYPLYTVIYYNFRYEGGGWMDSSGVPISTDYSPAYPSISNLSGGEAVAAYYHTAGYFGSVLGIDEFQGFGVFTEYIIPDSLPGGNYGHWPQVAVSANGDIHVLMTEDLAGGLGYRRLIYARSEDEGVTWTNPVIIDSVSGRFMTITASPIGEVAIVYLKPVIYSSYSLVRNDVCYIESPDGRTWDFQNPVYVTDYLNDNEDIFCPWGQDAVYDDDGNLHITWVTNNIAMNGIFINDAASLCYFNNLNNITEVVAEFTDNFLNCEPGLMNSAIAMPTISASLQHPGPGINVLIAFTGFMDSDVSAYNHCIGDIYVVEGNGFWHLWGLPMNVTETHTPNCLEDCESEEFPSLSEKMNGALEDSAHFTYVMRKYGGIPDTVYYFPIELMIITGVNDTEIAPTGFDLLRAYPNPFNAKTNIEFSLATPGDVELTIYDITGAKVETIRGARLEAGKHAVVWDAKEAASGVYFARMEAGAYTQSIKMVLLK